MTNRICRERELKHRILTLANRWEEMSQQPSTSSDWGPDVLAECAAELKAVLVQMCWLSVPSN